MASSAKSRKRTSLEASTLTQSSKVECRVCLQYVSCEDECCNIFNPWSQNPEATISCYFTQVTNIQVSSVDRHTKYICFNCLDILQNCVLFIEKAQYSDTELQKRFEHSIKQASDPLWPKPIQIDKCLNNENMIEVEVKQEVLSEDEVPMETDNEELRMEIKVEPEEYSSYDCQPQILQTISITPIQEDEIVNNSEIKTYEDDNYLEEQNIKEEPVSDVESDVTPDLSLDCMLCTKTFHSVSGLKAHVIAQHSYLTIARKTDVTPPIYQCFTCRRTFITRTDLIVHETCHGEFACYMCNSKFETFMLLTKHRKRCSNNGDHVSRLKTLDDVKRPLPDPQHTEIADFTNKETADFTNKETDSTNTEQLPQKIHVTKIGDLTTEKSQLPNTSKKVDSINAELDSQIMDHTKEGDSTKTELESQETHYPEAVTSTKTKSLRINNLQEENSTKTELKLQETPLPNVVSSTKTKSLKINNPQEHSTELKSQKPHHPDPVDSTNTELESQKMHPPEAGDTNYIESKGLHHSETAHSNTESQSHKTKQRKTEELKELERNNYFYVKAADLDYTESQSEKIKMIKKARSRKAKSHKVYYVVAADSTDTESESHKINLIKAADPRESHKMYYVDPTNKKLKTIHQAVDKHVIENQSIAVKTTYSSIDSNSSNAIKPITEEVNNITTDDNDNSKVNNLDSELNDHNIENDSEINNPNCGSTNQSQDLETQSIESEDFNLTYNSSNDTNEDLNSSDSETNNKIESSDLSQEQSLNLKSISPKLEYAGNAEMASRNVNVELHSDHISARENIVSEQSNLTLDSDNVSDSSHSVSKNSSLDNKESIVEINETTKPQAECVTMSLGLSKHTTENTPNIVAESDSMKIHLEIHSLKDKSVDNSNDVTIDEEMIENTESNDDKVLQ